MSGADEAKNENKEVVNIQDSSGKNELPRENLVTTAINFLQNSRVRNSPLSQKRAFLAHKGLTSKEIDIAIERSGINEQLQLMQQESNLIVPQRQSYSNWTKWKEMWFSVVILGVTVYGAYRLYKNYIEPKVFGKSSKSKEQIEMWSQLTELNASLSNLKQSIVNVQESLIEQQQHLKQIKESNEKSNEDISLTEIKTEVTSIKALLLSRHQFPSSRSSNPSIPSWQMVENVSQNEITSVSISEVESSGITSTETLVENNSDAKAENEDLEVLLEDGHTTCNTITS